MNLTDDLIINNILFNRYNTLSKLCYHAQKLVALDKILKSHLSIELSSHCRIGSIQDNFVVIETDRSEYLTQLKFNSLDLLSSLRKHPSFAHIITLKFKVCPEYNKTIMDQISKHSEYKEPQELSSAAKESLSQAMKQVSDERLKQALSKMIKEET